ncbi:MAG: SDR family NAD(P)-dependent oxidoreductase [Devosia sp.]|nr:SDR family NAD(P)-dependent oxidoreductase [Devosia sp.]
MNSPPTDIAYVITGPTSGIGYQSALDLAAHGVVILVGRNADKLAGVKATIERSGGRAVSVVCDMADLGSVQNAARDIIALPFDIRGVLNNAGVMPLAAQQNASGWDLTFATNYIGPFALTELLAPHLPDGANVVFVTSAIEDPERRPAKVMGMRGGRFISVEASAKGQWKTGGTRMLGIDAYATSKQCILAAALGLARENPRLHFNAVEPGITPTTGLGGVQNPAVSFIFAQIITRLPPFAQFRSTPEKSARTLVRVLTDSSGSTGVYFDEKGQPMRGSKLAHDPAFQDQVLAETRAFLREQAA